MTKNNSSSRRKKAQETISLRCPKCDSSMTYIRLKTDELVCRTCGYIGDNPESNYPTGLPGVRVRKGE
jgi:acetyl-CoA carboxylase beta subunit